MAERAQEMRQFVVYSDEGSFAFVHAATPQSAANAALQLGQFHEDQEIFVFDTKRALRFVRTSVAKRSDG